LNDRGGQWRTNVQIGYESLLTTSFYQPFDMAQRFFFEPELFASRSIEEIYVDSERVATYRFIDIGGSVDFGVNIGKAAQIRLGYLSTERRSDVQTGIANLPGIDQRVPEVDTRDAGLVAEAMYDTRSRETFARNGMAAQVRYLQSDESLGAERNWSRIEAGLRTAVPVGRNSMWFSLAGGTDLGSDDLPGDRAFSLGGPRTLAAYQIDEFRARSYWLSEVSFLWHIMDVVSVKNQAIYAGFGLQAAGLYDRLDRVADGDVYGASAYVGGPTPIGTLSIGVGASADSWAFWLSLGRPIGNGSILDEGLFR
jgi:NTE family protein